MALDKTTGIYIYFSNIYLKNALQTRMIDGQRTLEHFFSSHVIICYLKSLQLKL